MGAQFLFWEQFVCVSFQISITWTEAAQRNSENFPRGFGTFFGVLHFRTHCGKQSSHCESPHRCCRRRCCVSVCCLKGHKNSDRLFCLLLTQRMQGWTKLRLVWPGRDSANYKVADLRPGSITRPDERLREDYILYEMIYAGFPTSFCTTKWYPSVVLLWKAKSMTFALLAQLEAKPKEWMLCRLKSVGYCRILSEMLVTLKSKKTPRGKLHL